MEKPSFDFETLTTKVKDANYTNWEDPFASEYELISVQFEGRLMLDSKTIRHNIVLSKELWFSEGL
jgi:hypothetical protein